MAEHITLRTTGQRTAQIEALERLTGLTGPAAIIDFALATTLAHYAAQEVNAMTEIERIKVLFSTDSLFSGWENPDHYDEDESVAMYRELLAQELEYEFEGAEIVVGHSIQDKTIVNGQADHEMVVDVKATEAEVYESYAWVRYTPAGYRDALSDGLTLTTTANEGDYNLYASTEAFGPCIQWSKGAMPPHSTEEFDDIEALMARMAEIDDDWRVVSE